MGVLAMVLQLVLVQRAIKVVQAQIYKDLGSGYCRDNNGMYPNTYCRNESYSKATCQSQCDSDTACVAFQVGVAPDTHCCIYGAALLPDTAPVDWQFGFGNGGTNNITQAINSGRLCYKKTTCGSTIDCNILMGVGYDCQDNLCQATTTSSASKAWLEGSALMMIVIISLATGRSEFQEESMIL